jgi:hypothetical protein
MITAIACVAVTACAGNHPGTPSPAAVPPADPTLISAINADSALLRMDEPGYALVYAVRRGGGWRRISPEYTRPVKLPAGTAVAVAFRRPDGGVPAESARLAGTRSEPWPSEQVCAAAPPQLCNKDNRSDWVVNTPDRVTEGAGLEATVSYVVIVTATLPNLDRAGIPFQELRPSDVTQLLVRQVAILVPVHRWAEYVVNR